MEKHSIQYVKEVKVNIDKKTKLIEAKVIPTRSEEIQIYIDKFTDFNPQRDILFQVLTETIGHILPTEIINIIVDYIYPKYVYVMVLQNKMTDPEYNLKLVKTRNYQGKFVQILIGTKDKLVKLVQNIIPANNNIIKGGIPPSGLEFLQKYFQKCDKYPIIKKPHIENAYRENGESSLFQIVFSNKNEYLSYKSLSFSNVKLDKETRGRRLSNFINLRLPKRKIPKLTKLKDITEYFIKIWNTKQGYFFILNKQSTVQDILDCSKSLLFNDLGVAGKEKVLGLAKALFECINIDIPTDTNSAVVCFIDHSQKNVFAKNPDYKNYVITIVKNMHKFFSELYFILQKMYMY